MQRVRLHHFTSLLSSFVFFLCFVVLDIDTNQIRDQYNYSCPMCPYLLLKLSDIVVKALVYAAEGPWYES